MSEVNVVTIEQEPVVDTKASEVEQKSVSTNEVEEIENDDSEASENEESDLDAKESDESEKESDDKPKKKNGFKKRIDKLNQRILEKEREIELLKQNSAQRENFNEKPKETTSSSDEPNPDDFETQGEFAKAYTKWLYESERKAEQERQKAESFKSDMQKQFDSYSQKAAEFSKSQADFKEVINDYVEEHGDIRLSPTLQEIVFSSDNGPQLIYELVKSGKFEKINTLSPLSAAIEIGKIKAKLESQSSQKSEKKVTKATAPISPIESKASASFKKSPDDMTQEEYNLWRSQKK